MTVKQFGAKIETSKGLMARASSYNAIPADAPFGGYKQSGIGRETHKVILEHYTQMKNIMINLSEAPSGFYPEK